MAGTDIPLGDLFGKRARVQMKDGEVIEAEISCCTLCIGRFETGDKVYVCRNRDKYVVCLPLFMRMRKKKNNTCIPCCSQEETRMRPLRVGQG